MPAVTSLCETVTEVRQVGQGLTAQDPRIQPSYHRLPWRFAKQGQKGLILKYLATKLKPSWGLRSRSRGSPKQLEPRDRKGQSEALCRGWLPTSVKAYQNFGSQSGDVGAPWPHNSSAHRTGVLSPERGRGSHLPCGLCPGLSQGTV